VFDDAVARRGPHRPAAEHGEAANSGEPESECDACEREVAPIARALACAPRPDRGESEPRCDEHRAGATIVRRVYLDARGRRDESIRSHALRRHRQHRNAEHDQQSNPGTFLHLAFLAFLALGTFLLALPSLVAFKNVPKATP
jgi:hypothetical protein